MTGTDIAHAARLLQQGKLVAMPTETVYGLAANALHARAAAKIFEAKGRPSFNPLIVHVHNANALTRYALQVPKLVHQLCEKFSPGPITYVLPKSPLIPDIVTAGGDSVAIRIPAHPVAQQLLQMLDFPLAAPSANPSGYVSPVSAAHVAEQLGAKVSYILDGGLSAVGLESTVIRIENETIRILRPGAITREMLAVYAPVEDALKPEGKAVHASPGQLASHYAPRVPVVLGDAAVLASQYKDRKVGFITLQTLSPRGDLTEAAQNLFSRMRELDTTADIIVAQLMPDHGLGVAINDRLRRAAAEK